jgi:sortase (surface protein transpeptidase)
MRFPKERLVMVCATLLIVGGSLSIAVPNLRAAYVRKQGEAHNRQKLQAARKDLLAVNNTFTLRDPVSLRLPRLGISLDIQPGTYDANSKTWTLDRSHAFVMQQWQQDGHTFPATPVIYGHDIPAVFMHLNGVAFDELLTITEANGKTYTLKYVGDAKVQPHDDSVLRTVIPDTVLLMTCTGTHFEERRILQFTVVGSEQTAYAPGAHNVLG